MRLFFDSNLLTYIALAEGYLTEGTAGEWQCFVDTWTQLQGSPPNEKILHEVHALRVLYLLDEHAHFDWLCSDVGLGEVRQISNLARREWHNNLIERMIEHRQIVYEEESRWIAPISVERMTRQLFPDLPTQMWNDALQFCEASLVDADYFLTNDTRFIHRATGRTLTLPAQPSLLPFVEPRLASIPQL